MAIDKSNKVIDPQNLSPRSVNARCFHFYDHNKHNNNSNRIPSILRKNRKHPLRETTLAANSFDDESRTESESSSQLSPTTTISSSSLCSPSEKILKIVMPDDLDCSSSVPSSFSPPSNKLRMKKGSNEYREVSTSTSPRKSIRFHSKVLVMRIPSRNQYPEYMKRNLWCSLSEIARSAQRNTIEFSSEGWDWRSAIEEDSMYVHPKTGQYIHPVHVKRAASTVATKATSDADTAAEANSEPMGDRTTKTFGAHAQPAHE